MSEELIREQKLIADKILNKFKENNIECYLMGGAPRNWYFNKQANDLDFYIYQNNDFDRIVKFLKDEFIDLKELGNSEYLECGFEFNGDDDDLLFKGLKLNVGEHINDYISKMPSLKKVFECKYYNVQKCQFMIVRKHPMDIIYDEFGTTISQFYYLNDNKCFCTNKAKFSIETKTIYYKNGYDLENKYIKKMKEYFPDYEFKSDRFYEEDFIDYAKERLIDNLERNY